MCEVNSVHLRNIVIENGDKVLYIYDCIESTLSWYELYVPTLKDIGFFINPYDRFVAKK